MNEWVYAGVNTLTMVICGILDKGTVPVIVSPHLCIFLAIRYNFSRNST
jgi:hypothetical protein